MALVRDLSSAQIAFQVTGLDVDLFQVFRYRGTEGLCRLYRFEIEVATDASTNVTFDQVVGKPAVLSINSDAGERYFHGVVSRFEFANDAPNMRQYRIELVPAVWLLTQRYNSRIFQDKDLKQIISVVLDDAGIPADRFDMSRMTGTFAKREYCVQYRETDYNFIARLLEEEGVWWCFEQSPDKHVFVMANTTAALGDIPGNASLPYVPPTGLNTDDEHVFRFRLGRSVRPGAVALNDFDFKHPTLNLLSQSNGGRDTGFEFSDFPADYVDQGNRDNIARMRVDEFETNRTIGVGESNCFRLTPGRSFELFGHPMAERTRFLVTEITHEGKSAVTRTSTGANGHTGFLEAAHHQALLAARNHENPAIAALANSLLRTVAKLQTGDRSANRALTEWLYHAGQVARDLPATAVAQGGNPLELLVPPNLLNDVLNRTLLDFDAPLYACRFECVPAAVTYRPARITPWPVMRGTQTARVVGPEGEEIQVDEFGRVKVQFHWDRQGNEDGRPKLHGKDSSCFIRVAQGMAGGNYGIMFIPRVGQEVIVDFLEGDPDKPIIVGRVFNKDHMPPYELPKHKTRSVIKTHSTLGGGGCNEIRIEDLKGKEQFLIQAQRQMDTRVKASHFHTVGGSYHLLVGGEKDGELFGEIREKVFKIKHFHTKGELRSWIEKDEGRIVGGNQAIEIGGSRSTSVGKDVVDLFQANHQHEVTATYHLKAADIKLEASGGIELVCGGSSIVLTPGEIYINAGTVYINSGAGPAVAPPGIIGAGPAEVLDPGAADITQPGRDTRYSGASTQPAEPPEPQDIPGLDFPGGQPSPTATHFIDIELLDEMGRPVAGERYELITPDGKLRVGSLDAAGRAHEGNLEPGNCRIRFPRLDADAWQPR